MILKCEKSFFWEGSSIVLILYALKMGVSLVVNTVYGFYIRIHLRIEALPLIVFGGNSVCSYALIWTTLVAWANVLWGSGWRGRLLKGSNEKGLIFYVWLRHKTAAHPMR